MPHVLADQQPHPAEFGVKGAEALAPGHVALLVEQAVGGQVDLAVQVLYRTILQVNGRVEETVVIGDFDESDDNRDPHRQFRQSDDFR